jgi:hypothetical protein
MDDDKPVAARGVQWTLELIDEDVATYGNPVAHALARAGNVVYAEEYRAWLEEKSWEQRRL